jgi:hypothetical protein
VDVDTALVFTHNNLLFLLLCPDTLAEDTATGSMHPDRAQCEEFEFVELLFSES